jgi:hypothetical protein
MTLGRQLVSQSVRDDLISSSQKKIAIQLRRLGYSGTSAASTRPRPIMQWNSLLLCRRKLLEKDALACSACLTFHDDVVGDVHQPSCQIAGIGSAKGGVDQPFRAP